MLNAEDPYASMEKDQLISMIHFLVKREDDRAQEIQELKDMIRELKETHKEDVKAQQRLMKAIDEMTRRQADTDAENKELRQEIKNLLSRISVSNKVRFGSTSQKGTKKKTAPVQDREKDKDDFDGTYTVGPEYWAGWVLAYYQWLSRRSFAYMHRKGLGINEVVSMYYPLHEADLSKFAAAANGIIERSPRSR